MITMILKVNHKSKEHNDLLTDYAITPKLLLKIQFRAFLETTN